MSQKSINDLNINSITLSNSNYASSEGYTAQENTLTTNNSGVLLVNNVPISSGGSSNIRSNIYRSPTENYIPITSNTIYSHEFLFSDFNVTPDTAINVTFSTYNTSTPGTVLDPSTVPIWNILLTRVTDTGSTASVVINYCGIVISGDSAVLPLESINIFIMNN